jgi:hypothetical protein
MRDDPQILPKRLAAFVRPIPAKTLAQRIGCDDRTAENIRRGHWPIARHWSGLIAAFGADVLEAVFGPDVNETHARLQAEVRELEEELERKRAVLRQARDARARDPSRVATPEERAFQ